MRTTVSVPMDLVDEAMAATGSASRTETVLYALQEVVRRKRLDELKGMFGGTDVHVNLDFIRGRLGQKPS